MARAAVDLTTKELAELAGVRPATLNHFERGRDSYSSTVAKLRTVLEGRGAVFIETDVGRGVLVRR